MNMPGPVCIGISSIPSRVDGLEEVCRTLRPQCDEMYVALDGYEDVPSFLDDMDIRHVLVLNESERGSWNKFRFTDTWEGFTGSGGYYITCDDDILYPPDYVETLVLMLCAYEHKAIVSYHGSIITRFPVENYFVDRKCFHFKYSVEQDTYVHVAGTGCCGFRTDLIQPSFDELVGDHPLDDIWFSIAAQKMGVPIVVPMHPKGWILPNTRMDQRVSLYWENRHGNQAATDSINALGEWTLHTMESRWTL